jgi:hypothetical protein
MDLNMRKSLIAGVLILAAIATGVAGAKGSGAPPPEQQFRCTILVERSAGMMTLSGFIIADKPMTGEYRWRLHRGDGATEIRQSGTFAAAPGYAALAGESTLAEGHFIAELEATTTGPSVGCAEKT